jgi:hypothetical protein
VNALTTLTLGEFREITRHLPDETPLMYHAHDNGCCLGNYTTADVWFYPKDRDTRAVVLNPADDWDSRQARETRTTT